MKKGIKILKNFGNEYAQVVCLQGQGSEKVWVGNVYLPPALSLVRRGIEEEMARCQIEEVMSCIPQQDVQVVCGDWNARVADLSPTIDDISIPRKSDDPHTNCRAPWLIALCEMQGWHILNGAQPGPPACKTFAKGNTGSCIDLVLSNNVKHALSYDHTTL